MPDKLREKRNKFTEKFLRLPRMKAAFEDAWYLHGRMFGPIMEPAFVGEIAARFRLVSALNLISRGEVFTGMRRLDRLYEYCRTDNDYAAWHFFMGLCFEKMGFRDRAAVLFSEAAQREPEFYMVYLMLAKCLHEEKHYEAALTNYVQALGAGRELAAAQRGARRQAGAAHGLYPRQHGRLPYNDAALR